MEGQGSGRHWAFALLLLLLAAGAAIFFSIAAFGTAADTARHLIEAVPAMRDANVASPPLTSEQVRDLTPPGYAEVSAILLPVIVLATAPVLMGLGWTVIYSSTPDADPVTNVTVHVAPPANPSTPPATNVAIEILRDDLVLLSEYDVVYFDVDVDDGPEVRAQVQRIADRIAGRSNDWPCEILVYGHADSQGGDRHNFDLSNRRVQNVARELRDRLPDIPVGTAPGGGERRLEVLTDDGTDAWANRRVDVSVKCRK